jgi:RNA polymerase sigma-70 factor (ECF subfamily)
MNSTPASLLERVRRPGDQVSWSRFVKLYTPLLFFWVRRLGLKDQDAADLVQDIFVTLLKKLPEFRYDETKGFRNWLRTVVVNRWRDQGRRRSLPMGLADAEFTDPGAGIEEFIEREYRQHLVHRALELMRQEFPVKTWKACWEHVVMGRSAQAVADELGIAAGSVYVAKSRVLTRLRAELEGLLE